MSLNVGESNSRYVVVSNVTMKFNVSEKILFADLRTSRKTGNVKIDKETGETVTDAAGNPVYERKYTHWEGRFIGNAFEAAKGLGNGQAINIINGWIDKDEKEGKDGRRYTNVFVSITDFELPDDVEVAEDPADVDVEFNQ